MLGAVNRQVYATSLTNRFATLFYAVLDENTRTLHYVNAGHTPPLVVRRNGSVELLECNDAPVGMFPDWQYQEGTVQLSPGDLLIACTDGVTEAESPFGEMWGVDGLSASLQEIRGATAQQIVDRVFQTMDQFACYGAGDDATVVVLRVR
jgi:sigma-B regulation protein RsbU (phosphoserine phosphatase)